LIKEIRVINITTEQEGSHTRLIIEGFNGELDFGLIDEMEEIDVGLKMLESSSRLLRGEYSELADEITAIVEKIG
jgi:hypothetical protein